MPKQVTSACLFFSKGITIPQQKSSGTNVCDNALNNREICMAKLGPPNRICSLVMPSKLVDLHILSLLIWVSSEVTLTRHGAWQLDALNRLSTLFWNLRSVLTEFDLKLELKCSVNSGKISLPCLPFKTFVVLMWNEQKRFLQAFQKATSSFTNKWLNNSSFSFLSSSRAASLIACLSVLTSKTFCVYWSISRLANRLPYISDIYALFF